MLLVMLLAGMTVAAKQDAVKISPKAGAVKTFDIRGGVMIKMAEKLSDVYNKSFFRNTIQRI